jgi:membrane-bound metal-dependent hydrolase YbcI (DUF457 family)
MGAALNLALGLLLAAIAVLHLSWVFGSDWPAPKGQLAVYVTPGVRRPGRLITVLVAVAIGLAALIVLTYRMRLPAGPWSLLAAAGYFIILLVFLLRGMAGYFPALWRRSEGRPFHRFNRIYYSPLCLVMAGGLAANILLN